MVELMRELIDYRTKLIYSGIKPKKEFEFLTHLSDFFLSTGQKFNGVEESLGIEMKVKDEVTQEIKATTKNAFR
jgi:hypothetical protein